MKKHMAILLTAILLLAGCDAAKSSSSGDSSSSSESSSSEVAASSSSSSVSSAADDSHTLATLSDGKRVISKTMADVPLAEFGVIGTDGTYCKLFNAMDLPTLMPPAQGKPLDVHATIFVLYHGIVENRYLLADGHIMGGLSRALFLCDITTGELTRIFAYTPPEMIDNTITTVYLLAKPLVSGSDIYWDDIVKTRPTSGEADVNLWHYSTATGKAEQVATQGWSPFLSDGQVCYYGNGGKPYSAKDSKAAIYKLT